MFKNISKTIIGFVLFTFGCYLFFLHITNSGFGFFSYVINGQELNMSDAKGGELLSGDKANAVIGSEYPNLGIVSVRFNNRQRDSKDTVIFRIKEVGRVDWYYQSSYNTNQFQSEELFPFGFPKISGSLGRKYLFEIESVSGATESSIFIGEKQPLYSSVYFVDKNELYSNKIDFLRFIVSKLKNIFSQKESLQQLFLSFSPFVFYLLYISTLGFSYHFLAVVSFSAILWEIFYLVHTSDLFTFSIVILLLLQHSRFKFESKVYGLMSILFLVSTLVLGLTGYTHLVNKLASWLYIFLFFCSVVLLLENKKKTRGCLRLEDIKNSIFNPEFDKNSLAGRFIYFCYRPVTVFATIYIFYKTCKNIYTAIITFQSYFPDKTINSELILYLLIISVFSYFFVRLALTKKINILLISFLCFIVVNLISNNFLAFQKQPKILSISPKITSEAWVDVTITGKNFQDLPFVGKVTLAGEVQVENVWFWSNEKIIFRTNPATTKTGDVCVITLSKGNSNCLPFTYNFGK